MNIRDSIFYKRTFPMGLKQIDGVGSELGCRFLREKKIEARQRQEDRGKKIEERRKITAFENPVSGEISGANAIYKSGKTYKLNSKSRQ